MTHPYWPLFDLAVRTPRLELRYADDALVLELAALAARGVHDPSFMPFSVPWTDAASPELERNTLQHHWRSRAQWDAQGWSLPFVTIVEGAVVGSQAIEAEHFTTTRTFRTGSWLGQAFQGRGIGKEMRAAVLHFGFAGLGALRAESGAFEDNGASIAVTRALGYADNGTEIKVRRGERVVLRDFIMDRSVWEQRRRDDIDIVGFDACREWFGA